MKRWKCIFEEYNYELRYKPGRTNVVVDTLSRNLSGLNALEDRPSLSIMTQHSAEGSRENRIPSVQLTGL